LNSPKSILNSSNGHEEMCGELQLIHIPPSKPSTDILLKTTINPDPAELNHPTEV
jgi:hypothetical protein